MCVRNDKPFSIISYLVQILHTPRLKPKTTGLQTDCKVAMTMCSFTSRDFWKRRPWVVCLSTNSMLRPFSSSRPTSRRKRKRGLMGWETFCCSSWWHGSRMTSSSGWISRIVTIAKATKTCSLSTHHLRVTTRVFGWQATSKSMSIKKRFFLN